MFLLFCLFFSACSPVTPEKYFDVAVLNSNFLMGFANDGQLRELESPSMKMSKKNGEPEAMKRSEVISMKIQFVETNLNKLKDLDETADAKDILEASRALYEHVLPVYKTEYKELASLYDDGASKEQIQKQARLIHDKFYPHYEELYERLITLGKSYAAKHDIKVNWRM